MSLRELSDLVGRAYGPYHHRSSSEKVEEFVTATTDDPDRWHNHAPPGFSAVALFKTAPELLADPDVSPYASVILHVDQLFRWLRPLPHESDVEVTGRIESVRQRGNLYFVTFGTTAVVDGDRQLESAATFLMTEGPAPRQDAEEQVEPAWDERAESRPPASLPRPAVGGQLPPLPKSASRADLVRYAGATRDWNAIHWDHAAAVEAGLPGVICHGLLMAAWTAQACTQVAGGIHPIREMRLRFRAPLRPGVATTVEGELVSPDQLALSVRAGDEEVVTADATVGPE